MKNYNQEFMNTYTHNILMPEDRFFWFYDCRLWNEIDVVREEDSEKWNSEEIFKEKQRRRDLRSMRENVCLHRKLKDRRRVKNV